MKLLLILLFSLSLHASIDDIKTFEADFTQTVTDSEHKQLRYTGKLYLRYPNLVLWQYETPVEKAIYVNNEVIITYEPLLEQAIITKPDSDLNFSSILSQAKKIDASSYVSEIDDIKFHITVSNDGTPESISYKDKLQNEVNITFTDSVKNKEIESTLFYPSLPEGIDIIKGE